MRTISIVSQKGGAGKTTLAIHLATMAASTGHTPIIIDLDPQATAAAWSDWRAGDSPEVVTAPHTRLIETLSKAKQLGADIAIIDTPPHADAAAVQAVKAADLVLIPCRPQAFDLHAMKTTADLTTFTPCPVYVVFNGNAPQATAALAQATEIVRSMGLTVAPFELSERAVYRHATGQGRAVTEIEPIGKAAREVEALWEWVSHILGIKPTAQTKAA
ncbi:MAG: ParA family partition ATPase [Candidatus Sulfotelmatobacter sp.]